MSAVLFTLGRLHDGQQNGTDSNCTHGVQWVYHILQDCIHNDARGITAETFGLLSIAIWMTVTFPQLVKNCRNIQNAEGLSLGLLSLWAMADCCNFIGGILSKQLPLQVYIAIYFVVADVSLLSQFLYYKFVWKRKHKGYESIPSSSKDSRPQVILCLSAALFLTLHRSVSVINDLSSFQVTQIVSEHRPASRNLMSTNLGSQIHIFKNVEDEVGYAIGGLYVIFAISGRISQIRKTYKRKRSEGLSLPMFLLAVLGNLTYGLSILVRQMDASYVIKHLPWLLGSWGICFFDSTIVFQCFYYRDKDFDRLLKEKLTNRDTEIYVESSGLIN